jgi:hypothetical protein
LSDGDFLGGSSLLSDTHPVSLHIVHGFHIAETNALRVSVAKIALKVLSINDTEIHRAKGADRHTGAASNANVVIYHHPAELLISGNGLHGANRHTGGVLTLLAGHGNINPF